MTTMPTSSRATVSGGLALAEMLSGMPRVPRIVAQEIVVVGAALGCVLLSHPTGFTWSETAAVIACCALPLRLRWPWLAMLFCLWAVAGELGLAPALIGLYRIGRTARSPWVTIAWALAAVVAIESTVFALVPLPPRDGTLSVLFAILWMMSPSALGMLVTTRQRLAASLVELRLARAAELDARAERARSAERAKIGREIHDAVGHHATLIAVEAAALEATTAEEDTREVATRMRGLAKASLAEMRTALGLVGGRSESGSGLAEVPNLINNARQAGMTVDYEADSAEVLPAVGRAAFRIIQESLTNAAKHAPGTQVKVTITPTAETLRVTITSGPTPLGWTAQDSGGQGLTSMAERASTAGGELTIDHKATGMFMVRAHLPLESNEKSKVDNTEPTIDGTEAPLDAR